MNVTDILLKFADETRYEDIPEEAIHEAKRILLNGLGNALGGIASDKGKIGVAMARRFGGEPQATVIGEGGKVSAPMAAFANAELLNGLDLDPIPHIPPILLPAMLAVAEAENATGREFLRAFTVAQELALRITGCFGSVMMASLSKYGKNPDVFGNSNEHILGTAVGNAMLMKLDREKMGQALGIAAYYCPLPVCRDWESTNPKSMIKYSPVSWVAQGAVQAAYMAREGFTGNAYTLDSEFGFPVIYCRIEDVWDPEKVVKGLGENWLITSRYSYKVYPCCRFIHSALDSTYKLLEQYHFGAEEIEELHVTTSAFKAHPDQYSVHNQVDAQFSMPYNLALAVLGYAPGPQWQSRRLLTDPQVHKFMGKVKMDVDPDFGAKKAADPQSFYSKVEIKARGEVFSAETWHASGESRTEAQLSDEELAKRFRMMAEAMITGEKIERAIEAVWKLDEAASLSDLMKLVSR